MPHTRRSAGLYDVLLSVYFTHSDPAVTFTSTAPPPAPSPEQERAVVTWLVCVTIHYFGEQSLPGLFA